jgi:predicted ester cyclase
MSTEENKALIRQLNDLLNAGRLDEAEALYAPDAVSHNAGQVLDREAQRRSMRNTRASQPDLQSAIEALVAEGDFVVARMTMRGTHTGHLSSVSGLEVPPSGRPIESTGMVMYRIAGGKIAEMWVELDRLRAMQQMGAVAPPATAAASG